MRDTDFLQPDFPYASGAPERGIVAGGLPVALSIFADRPHLRATMRDDAQAAGLVVTAAGALSDLLQGGEVQPLGDVVLVDCPQVDAEALAALARLDLRAARCEARLIVSTSVEALDDVFSCMDQSEPVLLVAPNRAERVIALGQVLATFGPARLRDLSEDDRLMLLRLSEQVGQIAGRIECLSPGGALVKDTGSGGFRFARSSSGRLADEVGGLQNGRSHVARPSLPDARLVRGIIRQRQQRARFFDGGLFADPAWDMLLDLTAARVEHKRVSVTSLCIASGVPPTTALRWIGQMVEAGLFVRVCDDSDRRRAFIDLTDKAVEAMARYFAERAG
ncbi:winged helix DNA-binding protein [Novosphingobium mangrovi (ex Huang et al. 2023)]|uniref:MarR family transcriptional regulator n=1 Tax=Novosphingobium mangrovi (ex Huang et al. 2023) TaxID=2976432 RepID=A0ABT2I8F9_9SPHN|nr:winged helix DNA-binding protein [Novosphingobium mangrovi (ex Huang et al. 2023)]MCT2401102.1 MarR family transcriptional regulator [Novosphingobium mangrovi (ex Huang et al. 2023)]